MPAKNVQLLLIDSVENLGIVGDIVKVKPGYARNFLLPHGLAEPPSKRRVAELQERRKQVQAELARLRKEREELFQRMEALEIRMVRSCNDQGALYGSVTQRDIADSLAEQGYAVGVRSIRLGQPIKRVGAYHVPIQLERDLRLEVTLHVDPDHPIGEEREEMEFDNEGRLIRKPRKRAPEPEAKDDAAEGEPGAAPDEEAAPRKKGRKRDEEAA